MAQAGFTPIQLYRTTTASAQPTAGNLAAGELAINLTDKKLYAKDASNNVFVLADASSGGTTATNLAGGAAGSVPYQTGASTTTFLGIGTAAQVLQVNSGATAPEWVSSSGTGNVARTTSPSFTTPSLGAATALSINSLTLTTSTGTFTLANGKTLTVNNSLTLSGTDATTMTFPSTNATIARTDAAQTFTGTQTVRAAATQDAVALAGRAGGTSSFVSTLTPTTLSASRTVTLPDADTTVPVATQVLTFTGPTAGRTITLPDANFTVARSDAAQSFTGTQTFLSNPVLDAGTANGVLYLDGSKVVTSGSALTFDGTNLGIGTSSPGVKLDVRSATAGVSVQVKSTWSDAAQIIDRQDFSSAAFVIFRTAGVDGYSLGQFSGGASALEFRSGGLTRMLLDTSGNLGLGVAPSAWGSGKGFEIGAAGNGLWGGSGYLNLMQNTAFTSGAYRYVATATAARYEIEGNVFKWFTAPSWDGTGSNVISFTQAMTLNASGNLGIGTTSPVGKLDTRGTAYLGADANNALVVESTSSVVTIGAAGRTNFSTSALRFLTSDGTAALERMRIDSAGNMIIGTAALATTATDGFLYVPTCAGTPTGTPTAITGTAPIVVDTTNNKLYFYSSGQWRDAGP